MPRPFRSHHLWPDHTALIRGEPVTRRFLLSLVAIASVASLLLAACGSQTPAAPALTDPKDILTKTILSLKDVKTVEMTGTFTGNVTVPNMGALDLSSTKLSAALDIPGKKAKFNLDAPAVVGTKVDAILLDNVGYVKITGLLAGMAGLTADKYTKAEIPMPSADPSASASTGDAAQVVEAVTKLNEALGKLPTPPTKGADEACGDQQCYHVTLKVTSDDLKAIDPSVSSVSGTGDLTLDVWTRRNDLRPAKVAFSVTSPEIGTVGMTLELKYDGTVSVEAPPADQIAP
jgi:hypothetical protein